MQVEVLGDVYTINPQEDVKIDESDLAGSFLELPRLVELYQRLQSLAQAQQAKFKYDLERLYAILDHRVREEFRASGTKSTEIMVKNQVITLPEYQKLKKEENDLTQSLGILKSACQALWAKQACLEALLKGEYRASMSPRVRADEETHSLDEIRTKVVGG